jgi:hypothetical protein
MEPRAFFAGISSVQAQEHAAEHISQSQLNQMDHSLIVVEASRTPSVHESICWILNQRLLSAVKSEAILLEECISFSRKAKANLGQHYALYILDDEDPLHSGMSDGLEGRHDVCSEVGRTALCASDQNY